MKKETSIWKRILVIVMIIGILSSSLIGVYFGFKGMGESEKIEQERAQIEKLEKMIEEEGLEMPGNDEDTETDEDKDEIHNETTETSDGKVIEENDVDSIDVVD